jgi:YggT family protein
MDVILGPLFGLTYIVLDLYWWILIIWVVMSWLISFNVVNRSNRFVYMASDVLYRLTEPVLSRIRGYLPNLGGLDFSPVVLLLVIWFLQDLLRRLSFRLGVF